MTDESDKTEDQLRTAFKKSKALQDEFDGNEDAYVMFVQKEKDGQVQIMGQR